MMTIRCPCGEVFHADEQHIGRQLRCHRCGCIVDIQRPPAAGSAPCRVREVPRVGRPSVGMLLAAYQEPFVAPTPKGLDSTARGSEPWGHRGWPPANPEGVPQRAGRLPTPCMATPRPLVRRSAGPRRSNAALCNPFRVAGCVRRPTQGSEPWAAL